MSRYGTRSRSQAVFTLVEPEPTRKKNSYTNALFRRVAARRGGKRAQDAIAHSLLGAAWHVLTSRTAYHNLGGDYFLTRDNPDHRRRRAIAQLERLGYHVTIEPYGVA